MDKLVEWLKAEPAFLPNWAWVAIALVAVIIVVIIIIISVKGKKSAGVTESKSDCSTSEKGETAAASGQPAKVVEEPVQKKEQAKEKPVKEEKESGKVNGEKREPVKTEPVVETKEEKVAQKKEEKTVAAPAKKNDTTNKPAQSAATSAKKNDAAAKPAQTVNKPATVQEKKDEPATKSEQPVAKPAAAKSDNKPASKTYHISLRKGDGKWQVKIGGGEKAIKLFDTQLQAIDYAKSLAESQDANIVIHKKDGSFRKLTY